MAHFNYIATCIEPSSVNDGLACRFLKKTGVNLVLVKHNILEVYSVRNSQKSSFLGDELPSSTDRILALQKKYYSKDKITIVKAVRPYGSYRDNLLVLSSTTDLILLKYDRKTNDIVTIASAFVGNHMYPFSEVEHLCCVTCDSAYAALRLNCELIKVVRLEPAKGSRQLDSKTFHVDDSIIVNMGFIPDENDRVLLAMLTERGSSRHVTVYELLFGSVQAVRIFGTINNDLDLTTTQLHTFNYFNGGALILSSGMMCYYNNNKAHTFMAPSLKNGSIVCSCILNPYEETTIIIAADADGTVYQITRVSDDSDVPFAAQIIGTLPYAQKFIHIEGTLIFASCSTGSSYLFHVNESEGNVECEFLDIYPGYGPIIDMAAIQYSSNRTGGLLLCSGSEADGTLRYLTDGFEFTEKYMIDLDNDSQNVWVIGPFSIRNPEIEGSTSTHYSIVLSLPSSTMMIEMISLEGNCIKLPDEVANTATLYASEVKHNGLSQVIPSCIGTDTSCWLQITPDSAVVVDCFEPYVVRCRWTVPFVESSGKLYTTSTYQNGVVAVANNDGIYILAVGAKAITCTHSVKVERVKTIAVSFTLFDTPNYIAYNVWGMNEIQLFELDQDRNVACAIFPKFRFINSIALVECHPGDKKHVLVFASLTNGTIKHCDILTSGHPASDPPMIKIVEHNEISIPLSLNSKLGVVYSEHLKKLYIASYGDSTALVEINFVFIMDPPSYSDSTIELDVSYVVGVNHLNLPQIEAMFLHPLDPYELIVLRHKSLVFGRLSYELKHFISKTLNLYETPMKVTYQQESNSVALLTSESINSKSHDNCVRAHYNKLLIKQGRTHDSQLEQPIPISKFAPIIHQSQDLANEDPEWEWVSVSNTCKLVVLDLDTLYPIYTYCFGKNEDVLALGSLNLRNNNFLPYYVTTSNINVNPTNPAYQGFVKLYQMKNNELYCLDTVSIEGLVLSIIEFQGKLVVGISGQLHLYEINKNEKLIMVNQFLCGIVPAFLKVCNHELLVGDIMNNVTIVEMEDSERGELKITLQSDMAGWATSAHILNNGIYMNSNIERYVNIFTKERVCKSEPINKIMEEIGQVDDADIETCMLDDDDDPSMYRLIDDESRSKILDDNPKRYKVVGRHYIGEHITCVCDVFWELFFDKKPSILPVPVFDSSESVESGKPALATSFPILDPIANRSQIITTSTGSGYFEPEGILSYKPNYSVLISSSSGGVQVLFELTPAQHHLLGCVQEKVVRYHQRKRKSVAPVNQNNDLIYTKNLKKPITNFVCGDIVRQLLRLPKQEVLELLTGIPTLLAIPFCPDKPTVDTNGGAPRDPATARQATEPHSTTSDARQTLSASAKGDHHVNSAHNDAESSEIPFSSSYKSSSFEIVPSACYSSEFVFQFLVELNSLI